MQFTRASEKHFSAISNLPASPEELYMLSPKSVFPWDESQLSALFKARANHTVCLLDEVVAAYANLYAVEVGKRAFIGNVIVADKYKGQGLGKALVSHMLKQCRLDYDAQAHLSVFAGNTKALLMYAELGFEPYGLESRKGLDGEMQALIHMRVRA